MVFASARPIRGLLPVLPEYLHDAPLIGGNGAFPRNDGGGRLATEVGRHEIPAYSKIVPFTDAPDVIERVRALPLAVNVHADEAIVDLAPSGMTRLHALLRLGASLIPP